MAITASEARRNLFPLIDQVNDDQEPVEIVSRRGSAFLVSESQYRSLMETAYLLRSPANASRLLESIAALEGGQGTQRDLVDVDEEPAAALRTEPARGKPPTRQPAKKATKRAARGELAVTPTTADTPAVRAPAKSVTKGTAKGAAASEAKASKPSRR